MFGIAAQDVRRLIPDTTQLFPSILTFWLLLISRLWHFFPPGIYLFILLYTAAAVVAVVPYYL
jgi:hypothetical protein